jgi:uncharacterized membrane protein
MKPPVTLPPLLVYLAGEIPALTDEQLAALVEESRRAEELLRERYRRMRPTAQDYLVMVG